MIVYKFYATLLIILSIFFCLMSVCVFAKQTPLKFTINTEEMLPYNYTLDSGEVVGINTDIVKTLFDKVQINYDLKLFPWTRAYKNTLTIENNGLISTARTVERENLFKWVGPLASGQGYLYKLKNRKDINLTSLEDAKQYSVAVVRGGVYQNFFENLGFKVGENLLPFAYSKQYFQPFLLGKVDLILGSDIVLPYVFKKLDIDISIVEPAVKMEDTQGNFLAVNKNTPDAIIKQLNDELKKMKDSGEFQKIVDSYKVD